MYLPPCLLLLAQLEILQLRSLDIFPQQTSYGGNRPLRSTLYKDLTISFANHVFISISTISHNLVFSGSLRWSPWIAFVHCLFLS